MIVGSLYPSKPIKVMSLNKNYLKPQNMVKHDESLLKIIEIFLIRMTDSYSEPFISN